MDAGGFGTSDVTTLLGFLLSSLMTVFMMRRLWSLRRQLLLQRVRAAARAALAAQYPIVLGRFRDLSQHGSFSGSGSLTCIPAAGERPRQPLLGPLTLPRQSTEEEIERQRAALFVSFASVPLTPRRRAAGGAAPQPTPTYVERLHRDLHRFVLLEGLDLVPDVESLVRACMRDLCEQRMRFWWRFVIGRPNLERLVRCSLADGSRTLTHNLVAGYSRFLCLLAQLDVTSRLGVEPPPVEEVTGHTGH